MATYLGAPCTLSLLLNGIVTKQSHLTKVLLLTKFEPQTPVAGLGVFFLFKCGVSRRKAANNKERKS